ncbi:LrgB family protein [Nitrospirillum sp. BR 11164]|uniref:LrgB family protein n=1 Tax=Nitrospirillum sp. BR 11164 TaxID=3104324 RepID=UPI002AFDDB02|nr:LrgB family protein [Nitrospirillum sp. BR 11164]MEA1651091.1 LrgB family protein [Nitrospirillum sp. BR 11164]
MMSKKGLGDIWVYLSASPLLWLAATLVAYLIGVRIYTRTNRNPFANPVALAALFLVILLVITDTPYTTYFNGAQFIHFLLGPATVALAVPLWRHRADVRRGALPLTIAMVAGSVTAAASAVFVAHVLGADKETVLSLAPKSVTTPIAMGISESIGGIPSLTAAMVMVTGIIGAVFGPLLLRWLKIRDDRAKGLSMGMAAHGVGTAISYTMSPLAGSFAGIAMALNGLITALAVPLLLALLL